MSCNVFVGLTDENRVFFSGLTKHLSLKELMLPSCETQAVVSVGASMHTYYVVLEDGSFYCNKRIPNLDTNLYYGQEKLFKYRPVDGDLPGFRISGKYDSIVGWRLA